MLSEQEVIHEEGEGEEEDRLVIEDDHANQALSFKVEKENKNENSNNKESST